MSALDLRKSLISCTSPAVAKWFPFTCFQLHMPICLPLNRHHAQNFCFFFGIRSLTESALILDAMMKSFSVSPPATRVHL